MNYEVGKTYTFHFKEKYVGKDGNVYLSVLDPDNPDVFISIRPYSFQVDWDDISKTLDCFCCKQDIYGHYRFELSRDYVLNYLYGPYLGHYNEFTIVKRVDSEQEKVNCCIISDTYGVSQRYYTKDKSFWEKYSVEDNIILDVTGIHSSLEGKNNAYLELEPHGEGQIHENDAEQTETVIRNESLVSLGVEDDHTEFKSSIAFPAGGTEEDMVAQLAVIMKSVAGFMNKDGGTLYIGVNDSGEPFKDIKDEFQYLNDDENDNYTYRANEDQYKLKLLNKISHDLGGYASSLVNINFMQANGVTYAAIVAKKSDSVVWYQNTELYVRCDNSTRRMFGDSITKFIMSRVDMGRFTNIVNQPMPETETETVAEPKQPETMGEIAMKHVAVKKEEKAWRYMAFFKTGQWWFSKTPYANRDELITEIPVPQNPKSHVMMIAYASGKVNAVDLKELLYGTGRNRNTLIVCDTKRNNGLSLGNDPIVNVFCMKKGGLVLMESITPDGKVRVKAHQMEVVVTHNLINAQGNKMQKEGELLRMAPIEVGTPEMDAVCAMGILVKDYERYSKNGVNKAKLPGKYQELIDKILG